MSWFHILLIIIGAILIILSVYFLIKMKQESKETGQKSSKAKKAIPIIGGVIGLILTILGVVLGRQKKKEGL